MNTPKIALFDAPPELGQRITEEALMRVFNVTTVTINEIEYTTDRKNLEVVKNAGIKKEDINRFAKNHDVIIAFHEPTRDNPGEHVRAIRSFIQGSKQARVLHLIVVGHAFGKWTSTAKEAFQTYKIITAAQREALITFQKEADINWSYIRGAVPEKHKHLGLHEIKGELICTHTFGEYYIHLHNFIPALLDEVERSTLELYGEDIEEL